MVPAYELISPITWKPLSMGIWGPAQLEIRILEDPNSKEISSLSETFAQSQTTHWNNEITYSSEIITGFVMQQNQEKLSGVLYPVLSENRNFPSWAFTDTVLRFAGLSAGTQI